MLATVHALSGLAIGASVDNAPISFALGVASHFVLDMIPHRDFIVKSEDLETIHPSQIWVILADQLVMFGALFFVVPYVWSTIASSLAGMLGALLPDLISSLRLFLPQLNTISIFKKFNIWHNVIQQPPMYNVFIGLLSQASVIGLSLWVILR